jgi:deoxyribodipyrimidine photo-lyase
MNSIPLTRDEALAAWANFLPSVGQYAKRRNHVERDHRNVSRLSAALRYRTLLEDEVLSDTQRTYVFRSSEKWVQEVCWRRYWKGWLEQRPDVWTSWRRRVRELNQTLPETVLLRAQAVAAGESGVACMDAIAKELTATGYVHNHARMWWASFWIHAERLPWELGADAFYRHLLDADPASNPFHGAGWLDCRLEGRPIWLGPQTSSNTRPICSWLIARAASALPMGR